MQLQQLSNLIDTWGGDRFDPANRWHEEVIIMIPGGAEHEILSMSWDHENSRWVLCAAFEEDESYG